MIDKYRHISHFKVKNKFFLLLNAVFRLNGSLAVVYLAGSMLA